MLSCCLRCSFTWKQSRVTHVVALILRHNRPIIGEKHHAGLVSHTEA